MPDSSSHISFTEAKCPACGAPIAVPDGATNIFCTYCGTSIHVGYGSGGQSQPKQTGIEPDGTIRDRATGMGLFKVTVPDGWSCVSESVTQTATSSQPLLPKAILLNPDGAMIEIALGEAGDRLDGATKALMAMGGQHLAGIDRTNYAEIPDPFALEQQLAMTKAKEAGLTIRKANGCEQPPIERLEGVRQAVMEGSRATTRQTGGLFVEDAMCAEVIRTYDAEVDGKPWGMATAVRLVGTRYSLGGGMGAQVNDMMNGLGNMMRGIFGGTPIPRTGGDNGTPTGDNIPPQQPRQPWSQQDPRQSQQWQRQGGDMLRSAGSFLMGGGLIGKMMREKQGQQVPSQGGFAQQPQQGPTPYPYPTGQQVPANAQLTGTQAGTPTPSDDEFDEFEDWVPSEADAIRGQVAPQTAPASPTVQPTPQAGGTAQPQGSQVVWSVPDFAQFNHGNISWEISIMAVMIAPEESFASEYKGTFLPMLGATGVHPDVKSYKMRGLLDQSARNQQATNTAILQNQQMTQATLAAARERNAAFQSYNDAWSARSDAQHASFRAASNARFNGSPSGGDGADFSEAIRGVNTFVTSDGREVQLSVANEVAYENKAGDVVGGSKGFDPGADWTQMPQK